MVAASQKAKHMKLLLFLKIPCDWELSSNAASYKINPFQESEMEVVFHFFYVPYFSQAIQVRPTLTGNLPDFIYSHSEMHRSATIMSMAY